MLRYTRHARHQMARRLISVEEVQEARAPRDVTVRESERGQDLGDVLVIRATLQSGRRLKVVVRANDERFVITAADQDQEDR